MSFKKYKQRFIYIDSLIRKKATGNPLSLSKKLHLSQSGTSKVIKEMKEEGFPISYCKKRNSYIYTLEGKMTSNIFELNNEEMKKVNGGKCISLPITQCNYSRLKDYNFTISLLL